MNIGYQYAKPIPFYEDYRVDQAGNVYGKRGKPLAQFAVCGGRYLGVKLYKDGKRTTYNIHNLVMLAWVGRTPEGLVIDHFNQRRDDNRLGNLIWVSQQVNVERYYLSRKVYAELGRQDKHMTSIIQEARQ